MHRFIKNPINARILSIVERKLGYSISACEMSAEQAAMFECAVQPLPNGWTFLYQPASTISESSLCHEMMHVCLWIEGWPTFSRHKSIQKNSYEHLICVNLLNTIQHIVVWERVARLGFDNDVDEFVSGIHNVLLPGLLSGNLYARCPEPLRAALIGAAIAQALIHPSPHQVCGEIEAAAQRINPGAFGIAQSLREVYTKEETLSPQSFVAVLEKSLSIVSMPTNSLLHGFPPQSDAQFFAKLLRDVQCQELT
jgi:hypothetical protein